MRKESSKFDAVNEDKMETEYVWLKIAIAMLSVCRKMHKLLNDI